jgi:chromosome segregation ATPase
MCTIAPRASCSRASRLQPHQYCHSKSVFHGGKSPHHPQSSPYDTPRHVTLSLPLQDTARARAALAAETAGKDEALQHLNEARVDIATLKDKAALSHELQGTADQERTALRSHVRSLEEQREALQEQCARWQDETRQVGHTSTRGGSVMQTLLSCASESSSYVMVQAQARAAEAFAQRETAVVAQHRAEADFAAAKERIADLNGAISAARATAVSEAAAAAALRAAALDHTVTTASLQAATAAAAAAKQRQAAALRAAALRVQQEAAVAQAAGIKGAGADAQAAAMEAALDRTQRLLHECALRHRHGVLCSSPPSLGCV